MTQKPENDTTKVAGSVSKSELSDLLDFDILVVAILWQMNTKGK